MGKHWKTLFPTKGVWELTFKGLLRYGPTSSYLSKHLKISMSKLSWLFQVSPQNFLCGNIACACIYWIVPSSLISFCMVSFSMFKQNSTEFHNNIWHILGMFGQRKMAKQSWCFPTRWFRNPEYFQLDDSCSSARWFIFSNQMIHFVH